MASMAAGQEPTNAELMDAIVQLHAYVDSGFASVARQFVAVRHELRSEFRHEIGTLGHDMNRRFDRVDERFDRVDERFDRVDERFARVDERFDRLERRVEGLERPA